MYKIGARVQIVKNSHNCTPGITMGTITGVEIKYIVKEDGTYSFRHEAEDLKVVKESQNGQV